MLLDWRRFLFHCSTSAIHLPSTHGWPAQSAIMHASMHFNSCPSSDGPMDKPFFPTEHNLAADCAIRGLFSWGDHPHVMVGGSNFKGSAPRCKVRWVGGRRPGGQLQGGAPGAVPGPRRAPQDGQVQAPHPAQVRVHITAALRQLPGSEGRRFRRSQVSGFTCQRRPYNISCHVAAAQLSKLISACAHRSVLEPDPQKHVNSSSQPST